MLVMIQNVLRIVFTFPALLCLACTPAGQTPPWVNSDPPAVEAPGVIHPELWPLQPRVMERVPEHERRIAELLQRMTLEEKVGQVIQADISAVTPDEVREYDLGSVLNGGGSAPGGDNRTTPDRWLALADAFWQASTDTSDGGVGIPVIWGTDAVHGHSNLLGATIFPHNIGLGMANDPDMMYEIGRVTALEMLATGMDWTFAPTIAVVRNDRWGRTYESYSEDPVIVTAYAPRIIEGIQGRLGSEAFLSEGRMMATAKHFAGDGGTVDGKDQGDTVISEAEFRDIQAAAYPAAVAAGVQSVMASFNSFHGRKMHAHKEMLTDVLVGRLGFDGFVVGDWNGHGQVAGCTNTECAASMNAGLDMYMAPDSWKALHASLQRQVREGEISMARLDEAVGRILRVKLRAGVFDAGMPSTRPLAGDFDLLGAAAHRAVARDAVRKSLVLLKNNGRLLPLDPATHVLLAGDGAHDIGKQCGGWTLNWQGTGNLNEHFPNGSSILEGFREALAEHGGRVTHRADGAYDERPDVAVVVFGEDPYAEFQGDRPNVDYDRDDGLALLRRFQADGIPTVAVFLSGRPLWVNPEINAADAFVAAWLPGTEGAGIADVLVGDAGAQPRHDFRGRLSFSWPRTAVQTEVNLGDADYDPLFPYGFGLSYSSHAELGPLPLDDGLAGVGAKDAGQFMAYGDPVGIWRLALRDASGETRIDDARGKSPEGSLQVMPADHQVQEDTLIARWRAPASLVIEGEAVNFEPEANGDMVLELAFLVERVGPEGLRLAMAGAGGARGVIDLSGWAGELAGAGWQTAQIKLSCFQAAGADMKAIVNPIELQAGAGTGLRLSSARIVANPGQASCLP